MTLISVILPEKAKLFCTILNVAACAVLFIIRVYQQKKQKIEDPKLSLTGLLSIFFALLMCCSMLNMDSKWYFGDIRWCELSIKILPASYFAHRFLLYIFIILRVEAVNQANFISPRILSAGKAMLGGCGIVMVVILIIFTEGVPDEHSACSFYLENSFIVTSAVLDTTVCVTGTWLFLRPIRDILGKIENRNLRYMLRKTRIWSIVCLVSTLVALFTLGFIDGAAGVVAFDCSITSFGLVMMMSPNSKQSVSKSSSCLEQNGSVELEVSTEPKLFAERKLSPCIKSSHTEELNKQIDAVLHGSNSSLDISS